MKREKKDTNINEKHMNNTSDIKNSNEHNNMDAILKTFTHISKRLEVLSSLKGGYKIWLAVDSNTGIKTFEIDNTYFQPITRYLYGQCRQDIINTLVDDTNYIQVNFNKLPSGIQNILKIKIVASLPGLRNMKQTYIGNITYENTLNMIIEKLETYL
jgi:hypothetical protein